MGGLRLSTEVPKEEYQRVANEILKCYNKKKEGLKDGQQDVEPQYVRKIPQEKITQKVQEIVRESNEKLAQRKATNLKQNDNSIISIFIASSKKTLQDNHMEFEKECQEADLEYQKTLQEVQDKYKRDFKEADDEYKKTLQEVQDKYKRDFKEADDEYKKKLQEADDEYKKKLQEAENEFNDSIKQHKNLFKALSSFLGEQRKNLFESLSSFLSINYFCLGAKCLWYGLPAIVSIGVLLRLYDYIYPDSFRRNADDRECAGQDYRTDDSDDE